MSPTVSRIVQALEPSATLAMAAKAKELKAAGKNVFDFSVGEPDFTTPEHICQAAADANLLIESTQLVLDRLIAHPQSSGNSLVCAPFEQQRDDVALTVRQTHLRSVAWHD